MGKLKFGASERAREAYAGSAMWADSPGGKKYPRQTHLNAQEWIFMDMCVWIYVCREAGIGVWIDACRCVWVYIGIFMCANMCANIEINGCK